MRYKEGFYNGGQGRKKTDAYISQKRKNVNKKTGGRSGHSQITIKK